MRHPARKSEHEPTLEDKVAVLRRGATYPGAPAAVEAIETHTSWVFLTGTHAYKFKKPVRRGLLDCRRLSARLLNCRREVLLNRRLAPSVYLGLAALRIDASGRMTLAGRGRVVEWLVVMRRLREDKTLRHAIENRRVHRADLQRLAVRLAAFFRSARPVSMLPQTYRVRLERGIRRTHADLLRHRLARARLDDLLHAQLDALRTLAPILDARASHVVEGHGDLRPEHVYLLDTPVVIDCLEFNRDLRLLDPLDELAFLAVECEHLHAGTVGHGVLSAYATLTGERIDAALIDFYMCRHACVRASLMLSHLDDAVVREPRKWKRRAETYLEIAEAHGMGSTGALRRGVAG